MVFSVYVLDLTKTIEDKYWQRVLLLRKPDYDVKKQYLNNVFANVMSQSCACAQLYMVKDTNPVKMKRASK